MTTRFTVQLRWEMADSAALLFLLLLLVAYR